MLSKHCAAKLQPWVLFGWLFFCFGVFFVCVFVFVLAMFFWLASNLKPFYLHFQALGTQACLIHCAYKP